MVIAPALGEVVSASGGRYSEQNEAPRSKLLGTPSRKKVLGTARGLPKQIFDNLIFYRGVAKFGYRTCFGSRGPGVRIPSPRPK